MSQMADVRCWIKVIDNATGKTVANGTEFGGPGSVTVEYHAKNEGDKNTGNFWIVGSLYRDGVKITPDGKPNVVPAEKISNLEPGQSLVRKHTQSEGGKGLISYSAKMLGDIGNLVNESNEANNKAEFKFAFLHIT
jgi:hypothetical protein